MIVGNHRGCESVARRLRPDATCRRTHTSHCSTPQSALPSPLPLVMLRRISLQTARPDQMFIPARHKRRQTTNRAAKARRRDYGLIIWASKHRPGPRAMARSGLNSGSSAWHTVRCSPCTVAIPSPGNCLSWHHPSWIVTAGPDVLLTRISLSRPRTGPPSTPGARLQHDHRPHHCYY